MSRRRFYVPQAGRSGNVAELPPELAHRLRHVLRIASGAEVEVFDGEGGVYKGVVEISGLRARVRDLTAVSRPEEPGPVIVLGAALIKPARFEWMLEKTAELGVDEIVPLETRFSEARVAEAAGAARVDRWRRILQQASEQCGRARVPRLHAALRLQDWLHGNEPGAASRFLCCRHGKSWRDTTIEASAVALGIGPEGGWDSSEISEAESVGWKLLNLGGNTLRAETAAVSAVALFRLAGR